MIMKQKQRPVIKVENVTIGYGNNIVLNNINFEVKQGEIFAIMGGSGCGKTTLLKNIIGLYKPFSGDIKIYGKSMLKASKHEQQLLLQQFGVTYQEGALFGAMTLAENVALPLEEFTDYSQEKIAKIVNEKLKIVDLEGFNDYMPSELSGGMKKRAGVARALALEPKLLFFDEPSAGLDPITSADFDSLIMNLRDKLDTTIVIVTHELDSIFTVSDRVIMLDQRTKGIIAEGDVHKLKQECHNEWVQEFLSRKGLKV
ncbi:ATP-binding cassette domain-containing protein [Lentisphaerota bacterium WC36G]|nr:ATP-binding cassette domain-containing protein [Lentisphaerae bacterium WC36]